jgi:hypothetical protein
MDDLTLEEWEKMARDMTAAFSEKEDLVNRPSHYNSGQIETIDYIVDVLGKYESIHYCHGNVLKYLGSRMWNKDNPLQDARKAKWYLEKMITLMEQTEGENW